ncbi:Hypothetical protein ABZS17H1_00269 [Kosakonia cowanii]
MKIPQTFICCVFILCFTLLIFTYLTRKSLCELRYRDKERGGGFDGLRIR